MDSKKNTAAAATATSTDSEVRTVSYYKNELEVCKRELEAYKTLYWDLQVELDKLDEMRKKSVRYFALRRQKAIEKFTAENKNTKVYGDCECDCNGEDELDC